MHTKAENPLPAVIDHSESCSRIIFGISVNELLCMPCTTYYSEKTCSARQSFHYF